MLSFDDKQQFLFIIFFSIIVKHKVIELRNMNVMMSFNYQEYTEQSLTKRHMYAVFRVIATLILSLNTIQIINTLFF